MANHEASNLAYFLSITHCSRDEAIKLLEKSNWKVDVALNLFFEKDSKKIDVSHESNENHRSKHSLSSEKVTIIIPTMFEFQRFIETIALESTNLLENSSKMMQLAMKYATNRPSNIPLHQFEHWKLHVKVDYTRLQTLLDNDMCAPLVWIEHFEHLLNGNLCQLFDCDYMFNISGMKN